MGWVAYIVAWVAVALFWTLASASSAGRPPLSVLPFGVLATAPAAVMGLGVWRLTNYVRWNARAPLFYAAHACALTIFSVVYSTSWVWPDLAAGHFHAALTAVRSSTFQLWNVLLGSWLYLAVAGLSYAVHAQTRLRAQEKAAADAQYLAQAAQLAALRAQLNPHFLFNALHSVGALVSYDPTGADRALERLGDLLRYVLRSDDAVPLADEWRFMQDYLAFEQLRLGDRLRVDAAAESSALSVLVPPLILQPLVENAVRHGIAERSEGGHIGVRASVESTGLVLRVTDDGQGGEPGSSSGLGLNSVRQRLAALYGPHATLSLDTVAPGFVATVRLPFVATLEGRHL